MREILHLLQQALPEIIGGIVVAAIIAATSYVYSIVGFWAILVLVAVAVFFIIFGLYRRKKHSTNYLLYETPIVVKETMFVSDKEHLQSPLLLRPAKKTAYTEIRRASHVALLELLSLQYPWGEWSDRRSALESLIAERNPVRGPEGPKPNVARSMFAIEALELIAPEYFLHRRTRAIQWMLQDISDGWYREWDSTQSLDSESPLPHLFKRKDIRHTAQIASCLCRWEPERDPLSLLISNIAKANLVSGFWPDTPGRSEPRLLASVYAVESLGRVASGHFRLPITDLLSKADVVATRSALRRGISALLTECELGSGLLGASFSKPTAYMTGIALFRLSPLYQDDSVFYDLILQMVSGLVRARSEIGWFDHSVSLQVRPQTRKRSTLRVAAGLSLAYSNGVEVPEDALLHAVDLAVNFLLDEDDLDLDSPDFACALIAFFSLFDNILSPDEIAAIEKEANRRVKKYMPIWARKFEQYLQRVSIGQQLGLSDYEEMARTLQHRVNMLR